MMEPLRRLTWKIMKDATTEQLRECLTWCNRDWANAVRKELEERGESTEALSAAPAAAPLPPNYWDPWKSRPGTEARFIEEDESIHGVN